MHKWRLFIFGLKFLSWSPGKWNRHNGEWTSETSSQAIDFYKRTDNKVKEPYLSSYQARCNGELHERWRSNHRSGVPLHDRSWNTSKNIPFNVKYSNFHHDIFRQCSDHSCSDKGLVPSSAIKTIVRLPCKHRSQRVPCYTTSPCKFIYVPRTLQTLSLY